MKKLLLFFFLCFPFFPSYSQILTQRFSKGEARNAGVRVKKGVLEKVIDMPHIDMKEILKEDEEWVGTDVPYRFGYGFDVSYTLDDGDWENHEDGRLWSISFRSSGALSLNFVFENFYLPEGAYVNIVNSDESIVYGPVTSDKVPTDGFFLTDLIDDSITTIYLFEPKEHFGESSLLIRKVVHRYSNLYYINDTYGDPNASASCNIPVENGFPEYEDEANAVALILLENGTSICSGSLVISTDLSFKPYLLTAFHCINTGSDLVISSTEEAKVNHWLIKFGYRQQSTYAITFNGANYRAGWYNSDFALVELYEEAKQFSHLTWLGWDRTGNVPSQGVGIHHPAGDYMKISFDDDPSQNDIYPSDLFPYNVTPHWLEHWEQGIVQPGSSGSPLLNESKRVVGHLHGVHYENNHNSDTLLLNPCRIDYASYGKISFSWYGGGNNWNRLSNWLDPNGLNQFQTNSCHPMRIIGNSYIDESEEYYVENLPNGYTVTWSLSDSYYNQNCLTQDDPQQNWCTITCDDPYVMINDTLTAYIKYNGVTINTLTKTGLYAYNDIVGHYISCNISSDISYTHILPVIPNCGTVITSPMLIGATVSYSSSAGIPDYWAHISSSGEIVVIMSPNNNTPIVILIDDVFGNHFELYLFASRSSGVNVFNVDNSISVMLNEDDNILRGMSIDQPWTVEVLNATTGVQMTSLSSTSRSVSISTSGWPSGIYIVKVTIGKEVYTEKVIVK